jgi:hypothetical protein
MTDNDIPSYNLELVRASGASADVIAPVQQDVVYTPPSGGISNQMVIIVLAIIIGVVAIVYSRNCNCERN